MLDFATLPPEVNSARMYAGPGSAPMVAAASAWDAVAAQLDSFAAGYSSTLSGLQGQNWSGGASAAMAAAATPYVEWATEAAAKAEQAAGQARAAAAAFETAFAATVPPAAVIANRIQLATLVATNFFGQNAIPIAATEAAYAEMWAADAAAMYGYAASASVASTLTPFRRPPPTTDPAGQSGQAAAVAHALSATQPSGSPASASSSVLALFNGFNTLYGPTDFGVMVIRSAAMVGDFVNEANMYGFQSGAAAEPVPVPVPAQTTAAATMTAGPSRPEAFATLNRAALVGKLSVPQSWVMATPPAGPADEPAQLMRKISRVVPSWAADSARSAVRAGPAAGMGPLAPMPARPTRRTVLQMPTRRFQMPRPAVGG